MTYPPQPPPGYYPPPGWGPQKQGSGLKWLLIGVAVLLVVAISVGVTLCFTLGGSGKDGTTSTAAPPNTSDIASANDTGPVTIITVEPTCPLWRTIHDTLSDVEFNGWADRDPSSESSSWTPQVRAQYEAVGSVLRDAADQVVALAKQTPHRAMREMYEQFIAYGRAYAASLLSYSPRDNMLSLVNVSVDRAITGVCDAIEHGRIAARVSLAPVAKSPTTPPSVGDVSDPQRFIAGSNSSCSGWIEAKRSFLDRISDWEQVDSNIPATAWTPEQRRFQESGTRAMDAYAPTMDNLGRQQGRTFEDFAALGAQCLRVYAATTPSYTVSDAWIVEPGLRLNNVVTEACKAVVG